MKNIQLFSVAGAAREIGVTRAAIHYAVKQGLIASEKHGPYPLITASEVDRYKNNRPSPGRKRKIGPQVPGNTEE